jgi:hypothetical protein
MNGRETPRTPIEPTRETPRTSIEPTNMGELERLCAAAAKTGFFGAKSPEQALLIAMSGRDLGLSYSQALRVFYVIEGRPSLSADGMVAACLLRRDVCEYFRTLEATNSLATVETKRTGAPPQKLSFSMTDAKMAGLAGKANWEKYPSRMLLARARAALARDVYPDLLLGLYDPDELETTPASPLARVEVETSDGEVISGFRSRIGECATREELQRIGREVGKSALPKVAREALQAAYVEAMKRVAASAPKKSAPPPTAEDAEQMHAAKEAADAAFE